MLGRLAAAEPDGIGAAGDENRAAAPPIADRESRTAERERFLTEYQDAAYATRYRELVTMVVATEDRVTPGRTGLADAVIRYYFKLLAYKDEYEVARLHAGAAFQAQINGLFEGPYRLRFHLAPPGLARGRAPRKREFGSWMLPVFRVLARLRFLRGTAFDPFGRSVERKLERRLIVEYEQLLAELCRDLTPSRLALAVEIASLPEHIRGFGHVKQRHLQSVRNKEAELLAQWRAPGRAPTRGLEDAA